RRSFHNAPVISLHAMPDNQQGRKSLGDMTYARIQNSPRRGATAEDFPRLGIITLAVFQPLESRRSLRSGTTLHQTLFSPSRPSTD
ncbi:MAG: hypothetical protein NTY53_22045, partial [Kiritimatiellaeota bacterium]|nr:hypothetical protein [Kiritimatiellota bacterium]